MCIRDSLDSPYFSVSRVRAWIDVGGKALLESCFGEAYSPALCRPRPTDPQGEITVSLKPREANRILVPLRKLP